MAYQPVDIGAAPNDGTGDPIRDAFDKINDNFVELYGSLAGLLDFQGATDCSANPNYPAASQGDIYIVSVAGKIGGASGKVVEVGDFYLALADNAGGTEASVGTSWAVLQANITGGSVISELDDVPDVNAPSPSNGDVLTWDSTPGEWVPAAPTGGANALDDLTDVDAPTPSDGDVLTFDSGSGDWVPAAPSSGGAWTVVSDVTYTSGGTINISGLTLTGYSMVKILVMGLTVSGDGRNITLQLRNSGGAITANYKWTVRNDTTGSATEQEAFSSSDSKFYINSNTSSFGLGNASTDQMGFEMELYSPGSTALYKNMSWRGNHAFSTASANNGTFNGGGSLDDTSAVTGFLFATASTTTPSTEITAGRVVILGI